VGLGAAEAAYEAACAQASLEPVAVGYRTVPLAELMGVAVEAASGPQVQPAIGGGVAGGGFDASAAQAQIQASRALEAKLESEMSACLASEEEKCWPRPPPTARRWRRC
jgi:hypothetical protein